VLIEYSACRLACSFTAAMLDSRVRVPDLSATGDGAVAQPHRSSESALSVAVGREPGIELGNRAAHGPVLVDDELLEVAV